MSAPNMPAVSVLLTFLLLMIGCQVGLGQASPRVRYDYHCVFQYGGASKSAVLFPKVSVLRRHVGATYVPYYGLEAGLHPALVAAFGSYSAIAGIARHRISCEVALGGFWISGTGEEGRPSGIGQYMSTVGVGVRYRRLQLKFGRSFILYDRWGGQADRTPLLDFGTIGRHLFSLELQIALTQMD